MKKVWALIVAAGLALAAVLFGRRDKPGAWQDERDDALEKALRAEAHRRRTLAVRDAEDRRAASRSADPADRMSGILRRARGRLRRDKQD